MDIYESIEKYRINAITYNELIDCWTEEFECSKSLAQQTYNEWWDFKLFASQIEGYIQGEKVWRAYKKKYNID